MLLECARLESWATEKQMMRLTIECKPASFWTMPTYTWRSHVQAQDVLDTHDTCSGNSSTNYCVSTTLSTAKWNYGANFGGPTKSTWTSGSNSLTAGVAANSNGAGMMGHYFIGDPSYEDVYGGTAGWMQNNVDHAVSMCAGTAGAVCRG